MPGHAAQHNRTKEIPHERKIQPSPPPPTILRELFNDIAANVVDAVDHEGRATAKGLVALIQEVSLISGTPCDELPKPSQVDEVSLMRVQLQNQMKTTPHQKTTEETSISLLCCGQ